MTREAKKRKMRRIRVPPGAIRRGAGGDVEMIEFNAYTRNPLAPKLFVNDVGGIYRIHPSIWQVTFIQKFDGPAGVIEAVEQGSLIWPEQEWYATGELFRWAMTEIARGKLPEGERPRHPRGAH